ncbi:hypothetical protein ACI797_22655 [Geodermatophilus sp. SYSU D00691]
MPNASSRSIGPRLAVAAAAVGQVALPSLLARRLATVTGPVVPDTRVMPAAGTFAIWGPVFASSLGFAAYQAGGSRPLPPRLGWAPVAAFGSTAVWAPLVATRRFWAAQLALTGIAGAAGTAWRRVNAVERTRGLDSAERWLVAPPFSLLAGWGAAATGVNLVAMLKARGIGATGRAERSTATAAVTALGALGAAAVRAGDARTLTARLLGAIVLWALGGIAAGQRRRPVAAGVAAAAAVPTLVALRSRRG